MKVAAALTIISLLSIGYSFAQDEVAVEDQAYYNYYYYQDCPCCYRSYFMYRRHTPEQEQSFRELSGSYWPSKRHDSIIDEVRW